MLAGVHATEIIFSRLTVSDERAGINLNVITEHLRLYFPGFKSVHCSLVIEIQIIKRLLPLHVCITDSHYRNTKKLPFARPV